MAPEQLTAQLEAIAAQTSVSPVVASAQQAGTGEVVAAAVEASSAGAGSGQSGSGGGAPASDPGVIYVKRAHDYEPLPANVVETGQYRRVEEPYSAATVDAFNEQWATRWRSMAPDDALPEITALLQQEFSGSHASASNDLREYWAGSDNSTPPPLGNYFEGYVRLGQH